MDIPSKARGCNGKTNVGSRYKEYADELSKRHGKRYLVYDCPHCGGRHLTTKLFKSSQYTAKPLYISGK